MSHNSSNSLEKYSYSLSPFNFEFPSIKKRSLSCSSFRKKYSSLKEASPKNKNSIFIYESNEKERYFHSGRKTKSNSTLTNSTNSYTIYEEKKKIKMLSGLNEILSKFIFDEKLLLNSKEFFPKNFNKDQLPFVIDINKEIMENEKCYYYKKLSENIVYFYEKIKGENDIIFPFKKKLTSIVLKIINQTINNSIWLSSFWFISS